MYQVRILDKNKQLKAALPGVRWYYKREINAVGPVEVYIPKTVIEDHIPVGHSLHDFFHTQSKLIHAEIASFVQVYKGNRLVVSGKITGRTLGQVVTVFASTEEILLESSITPAQYGAVWDGWDLADVARDLLDGWQTLRVKAQEQWQDRIVSSSNVDLTTDPGKVMLAKRSNGRYYDSGYITLLFNKNEIIDFKGWDRIRWSADSDGPGGTVQTTIQWSSNGSSFTTPFDGGLPEEVGLFVGGNHDQVWVRINLTTEDTESPDPEDNPRGVTPIVFACELIARTHGDLVVGSIPSVAGETVTGLSANYATALKVLHEACDQVGWEFSVWDGALNIAENLGVDRTKDFVFRAGSNIEITALGDSDDELVNVLTAYGPGRGINRLEITLRDEASIGNHEFPGYGERHLAMEFNVETLAELQQKAQEYLVEHSTPRMDFAITVVFEHGQEPDYGLGDTVRVADPDTGIIAETRIVTEAREYGASGLTVNLELGKPSFTLAEAIGRDGKDGKDGKDGRDGRDGKDGKDGELNVPIPADPVWNNYLLTNALHLTWYKAEHATGYEIRDDLNWGAASGMIFRGYAHSLSFIPRDRELILYLRALNVAGEYSEGYDTIHVSLPAPQAPQQPTVEAFFNALRISPTPLNSPSVMGYYVYVTGGGIDDKLAIIAGGSLTYPLPSGTTVTIQVSAYDILGEGGKSEALQATTTALDPLDLPDIPKSKLEESLREQIDTTSTKVGGALTQIEQLGERLEDAEDGLSDAQDHLDTVDSTLLSHAQMISERVTQAVFEGLESRVDSEISYLADEISARVTQTVFETLAQRVTDNEATLTVHADMIAARVTQEVFDQLEGRVTTTEGELQVLADEVSARVSQTVFDALEERVTTNESTLSVHADMIAARVTSEVFDLLEERVETAEGQLTVLADEVSAKVSQTVFDTLAGRVETAEGILEVLPGQINAKADQSVVDTLTGRVEEAEGQLSVLATEIAARVTQEVFDTLEGRVETAEGELSVLANEISLKVSQTVFDELEGLVSSQGTQISLNTESITGVVSRVQSVEGQVTEHASQIQLLGDEITLKVQRTVNGEMVVTGIGMGFDETGQSIIPVLADRFVVKSGVNDEGQYAFLVDSETGKVYVPGELTVGGLLRASELQVDLIKSLLIQGEVAYLDEADVLHLRADKITVGGGAPGLVTAKPSNSHLWHFDNSLQSTQGLKPSQGSATLVPDAGKFGGGVHVKSTLAYQAGATSEYTVAVYRPTATLLEFLNAIFDV